MTTETSLASNRSGNARATIVFILVKNPWVHGLNKSRVPSHNGGTITITQIYQSRSVNIASVVGGEMPHCFCFVKNKGQ